MDATTLQPHHQHHAFPASWTGSRMLAVCFVFILTIYTSALHAQCTTHVTHTSGTVLIGCTQVTAVPFGGADVLASYCVASTTPYIIGYSFAGGSATGGYTFTFSPPVSGVTINVSGISLDPVNEEDMKFYVNGVHYAVPAVGPPNGCDPLAQLNGAGDIIGCNNCSVSGFNGTTITGTISTLRIIDSVVRGAPAGALFGLYICPAGGSGSLLLGPDTTICQGRSVTLNATTAGATSYLWSTGATTPTISVDTTGTYSVLVNAACPARDTIRVTVLPRTSSIGIAACGSTYNYNGHIHAVPGTYTDTLVNSSGCDSIVTLTLTSQPVITSAIARSICTGSSTTFGGQTITTAGTYRDTLPSVAGCDSIVTLTLTVQPALTSSISRSICTGGSTTFGGQTLTTAGTYRDTLPSVAGCDSIVTLTLIVQPILTSSISRSICAGGSTAFGGQTLTTAGTYRDTLPSVAGCDSIVTLTLTAQPALASSISRSICTGGSINFGGQTLTNAGTYRDTLPGVTGCDSIVTLTLAVQSVITSSISQSICSGNSITFDGQTLSTSGTYRDTLPSIGGCDSIVTLTLTVVPVSSSAISQSICYGSSTTFGGQTLTTGGIYYDTLQAVSGCDSIVTLTLSVQPSLATAITQRICPGSSFSFGGQTLISSGTYIDTVAGVSGCDSIITLTLTVEPLTSTGITQSICSGTTISFGGQVISAAGTYYDTLQSVSGCDSIVALSLGVVPVSSFGIAENICSGSSTIFGGQTLTTAGTYYDTLQAVSGCDSIVTLILTVSPPTGSSTAITICQGSGVFFAGANRTTSGVYHDTLSAVSGCDSLETLVLTVQPRPVAGFLISPFADSVLLGDISVTDYATGADQILWQLNNDFITLQSGGRLPITASGSYCLRQIATSAIGCSDTSTTCLYVYDNAFYLPNAFTPNGDYINDDIRLYGRHSDIKKLTMSIFNRWGERVFLSNDLDFAWDGRYKGQLQEPGIFVYTLDVTFENEKTYYSRGSITLLR